MSIAWPSERVSGTGLALFALSALSLVAGVATLRKWGLTYHTASPTPALLGFGGLILSGVLLFRLVRRREYPWIVALAAVALPLFQPSVAPYLLLDRIVAAVRDLVLMGAALAFVVRSMRSTDELEQRIHLRALGWSFAATLVALFTYTMAEDVLPPLRGAWVMGCLLGTWVFAWFGLAIRYQR